MLSYLRKHMKTVMVAVVVVFAASMFYGLGYSGLKGMKEKKSGIASVNGREIDKVRLNQSLGRLAMSMPGRRKPQEMAYLQMLALSQVVDFQIMFEQAKKEARVSGGEVDQAMTQIMQANNIPSMKDFESVLERNGLKLGEFKRMIKDDILVQKMVSKIRGSVVLSPNDLREVRASHILISPKVPMASSEAEQKKQGERAEVDAKALADSIEARLKKGENFSALAAAYSDDPGSKAKGGDLGYFTTGMMVPEFDRAAFSLKPGETSPVIKTMFGYHIIRLVDSRIRQNPQPGKDIKEVVLAEKQDNAFRQWFAALKQKAKIEIFNPVLKAYDYRLRGQSDMAIAEYNTAISENPADPYIHLLLADTYSEKGELELSVLEYNKAISMNPNDPDLLIALGKAYEKFKVLTADTTGKYRTLALEQYKKASVQAGEAKDVHQELAEIFKKLGENALANAETKKIAQIELKEKFEAEIKKKMEGPKK